MITMLCLLTRSHLPSYFGFCGVNAFGKMSFDEAESRLGKGLVVTGDRGSGALLWRLSRKSHFVFFLNGADYAPKPHQDSIMIQTEFVSDGRVLRPDTWKSAPIIKRKPGPFWTLDMLQLPETSIIAKLKKLKIQYEIPADSYLDILGMYKGQKYFVIIQFNKKGFVEELDLSCYLRSLYHP